MKTNGLPSNEQEIRGTDSNSLLRLYDLANQVSTKSLVQSERARADKMVERIARELRKRNVPV
jgi:hypothetical protein